MSAFDKPVLDQNRADAKRLIALRAASADCQKPEAVTLLTALMDANLEGTERLTALLDADHDQGAARIARLETKRPGIIFELLDEHDVAAAVVKLLLERGADPNGANAEGETALMLQAGMHDGDERPLKLLVSYGADPTATSPTSLTAPYRPDTERPTAYDYAVWADNANPKLFLATIRGWMPIEVAAACQNSAGMRLALRLGRMDTQCRSVRVGTTVELCGLVQRLDLNSRVGKIEAWDEQNGGRWVINLLPAAATALPAAAAAAYNLLSGFDVDDLNPQIMVKPANLVSAEPLLTHAALVDRVWSGHKKFGTALDADARIATLRMVQLAMEPWAPDVEHHMIFHRNCRNAVRTMMLVAQRAARGGNDVAARAARAQLPVPSSALGQTEILGSVFKICSFMLRRHWAVAMP